MLEKYKKILQDLGRANWELVALKCYDITSFCEGLIAIVHEL